MRKPSPALIVALVALFFAVGGSALAAGRYLISSASQIKPSVVQQLRSLHLVSVEGPTVTVQPGTINDSFASCPTGYYVVSGGYGFAGGPGAHVYINHPVPPRTWDVGASARGSSEAATVQAIAVCASEAG